MKSAMVVLIAWALCSATPARAAALTIAAASSLKPALDEVVLRFAAAYPHEEVVIVYGSSGKLSAQIRQAAPFDLFFSADTAYPRELADLGFASSPVILFAIGRLVLWTPEKDAPLTLESLLDAKIARIAIANPRHAPYGMRAAEVLHAAGLWGSVSPKLIYGESVAAAAQYVHTGNAQAGIIAWSTALSPALLNQGTFELIAPHLHQPLDHEFLITKHAESKTLARAFADFVTGSVARRIFARHGFSLPGEVSALTNVAH